MGDVVPIRKRDARPASRLIIRDGTPPKLVAMADLCDGVIVVKLRSEELTASEAESLARGLLTLAASARNESREQ
jgi:hypothetical protein